LDVSARDFGDIGRAAVEGLMQLAWIDEANAEHYERLVETVFVLMAKTALTPSDAPAPSKKAPKTSGRS
jgi:hypothetical protein